MCQIGDDGFLGRLVEIDHHIATENDRDMLPPRIGSIRDYGLPIHPKDFSAKNNFVRVKRRRARSDGAVRLTFRLVDAL